MKKSLPRKKVRGGLFAYCFSIGMWYNIREGKSEYGRKSGCHACMDRCFLRAYERAREFKNRRFLNLLPERKVWYNITLEENWHAEMQAEMQ